MVRMMMQLSKMEASGFAHAPAPGDVVEVKPLAEILATLDSEGRLDGLPFMPEMATHAGRRYVVSARLANTCVEVPDVGFGAFRGGDVVVLDDLRCDGSSHDGCQKFCSLLWKAAWLEPLCEGGEQKAPEADAVKGEADEAPHPDPASVLRTRGEDGRYICQSTELAGSVMRIAFRKRLSNMIADWRAVSLGAARLVLRVSEVVYWRLTRREIDRSSGPLGLAGGQRVRVKPAGEIVRSLDHKAGHRGLIFPRAMLAFCDRVFVVKSRVERMIREDTGKMVSLKDTVLLEGAVCDGITCHGLCQRKQYYFWRESWLEDSTAHSTS
jgi:hypothetical protein